jgi:phytanoyl-CoA hydroxylase
MHALDFAQQATWTQQGYLVLERAFTPGELAPLARSASEIVDGFDADRQRTIFSTGDRDAGRDDYFFDSAEAIHCFLEEGAVDADGRLNRPRQLAINKIGHALHDLVPEFSRFCRHPLFGDLLRDLGLSQPELWQSMVIFKQPRIGGEVRWHQEPLRRAR